MDADVFGLQNDLMFKNLFKKVTKRDDAKELSQWIENGKPFPPAHIVKQNTILEYSKKFSVKILFEIGTYLGDMIEAQKNNFEKIYSVELSEKLYTKARKRFREDKQVILLQGDSGLKIEEIINQLYEPVLFWLDGHYSGGITARAEKECPVREELNAIFKSGFAHIILIDDARLFNGTHDYPTFKEIESVIKVNRKKYIIENKDDIIRLIPNMN